MQLQEGARIASGPKFYSNYREGRREEAELFCSFLEQPLGLSAQKGHDTTTGEGALQSGKLSRALMMKKLHQTTAIRPRKCTQRSPTPHTTCVFRARRR